MIGGQHAQLELAISQLEQAAAEHEDDALAVQALMFRETPVADTRADGTGDAGDVLATVLADLDVANVLIAAGHSVDEAGAPGDRQFLTDAIRRLDATTGALERAAQNLGDTELGFTEPSALPQRLESPDLATAISSFRARANETLTSIARNAEDATTTVTDSLRKLDPQAVMAALGKLGEAAPKLASAGRLLRQGIAKLERAIGSLGRLLEGTPLDRVRKDVLALWEDVKSGRLLGRVLAGLLDVDGISKRVQEMLATDHLVRERLDEGSGELSALAVRFESEMSVVKRIASAVALAAAVIGLTQIATPTVTLVIAGVYALIVATVVVIAMDYTGSHQLLDRVRGVNDIVRGMTI
jgi:hypothetical protein